MTRRGYSNVAYPIYLVGTLDGSSSTNTITVSNEPDGVATAPSGWPATKPYYAVIDPDTPSEEVVSVTASTGSSLTITRGTTLAAAGWGTSTKAHQSGAKIVHVATAADFDEANLHVNSTTAVHGLAVGSAVVGTNDTQTLANKTLSATTAVTGAGTVVGTTNAQTLTNKTLTSPVENTPTITNPTINGTQVTGTVVQTVNNITTLQYNLNAGALAAGTPVTPLQLGLANADPRAAQLSVRGSAPTFTPLVVKGPTGQHPQAMNIQVLDENDQLVMSVNRSGNLGVLGTLVGSNLPSGLDLSTLLTPTAWTPTVTASTTAPNLGTGSSVEGWHIALGKLVWFYCRVIVGTGATPGSGTYSIGGLPFALATQSNAPVHGFMLGSSAATRTPLSGYILGSTISRVIMPTYNATGPTYGQQWASGQPYAIGSGGTPSLTTNESVVLSGMYLRA